MKDDIGRFLAAYENALWYQSQRLKESAKNWDSIYALLREHHRMEGLLSDALWAAASSEAPENASF